ncbi:MAG: YeeE/YedE family protein [Hoeflea sp.]|uniref:YeeE/YedE family protein n=1 Tax=Hoeflea sp. TaxID=1940281 RepID=UPI002731CEAC|nr:YeeE/YedE family protein [Hoeflea sp.]MDP2120405.1 YeeE/YedE family protein [Hoeflea sp.]MDZ7602378.1 YeeE/YedE family protein [Hoeflea sp.]
MAKLFASLVIGAIFGLGIAISGMANPAKVLNFFDVAGTWDPSLIFVMGGALLTTALGYRLVFGRRQKPMFDAAFHLPVNKAIDTRLLAGSATFGIGWGIAGFCPGGAIPALGFGGVTVIVFTGAMVIGIVLARSLDGLRQKPAKAF